MDIQGDSLQRQLKAFAVLQPVVLELQSSFLGPIQRQSAALDIPAGLKGTITAKVEVSAKINSVAVLSDGFSVVMLYVRLGSLTSLAVSAYSLTLSTDTILFSTSVHDLTIQLRIPVTCEKIHNTVVHFQLPGHYTDDEDDGCCILLSESRVFQLAVGVL